MTVILPANGEKGVVYVWFVGESCWGRMIVNDNIDEIQKDEVFCE